MDQELVLVCQSDCNLVESGFQNQLQIAMKLPTYHKSLMSNTGVKHASGDILVLLDSDRILPRDYFAKAIKKLKKNEIVSTERLYRLSHNYSDTDIDTGNYERFEEFRSKTNEGRRKNLFAGNTVMYRETYLRFGGYDEKFVGYGFSDTDITMNMMSNRLVPIWLKDEEIHLQHDHAMCLNNTMIHRETFKIITATNALRYCTKWKIGMDAGIKELINEVEATFDEFPPHLRAAYLDQKRKILVA